MFRWEDFIVAAMAVSAWTGAMRPVATQQRMVGTRKYFASLNSEFIPMNNKFIVGLSRSGITGTEGDCDAGALTLIVISFVEPVTTISYVNAILDQQQPAIYEYYVTKQNVERVCLILYMFASLLISMDSQNLINLSFLIIQNANKLISLGVNWLPSCWILATVGMMKSKQICALQYREHQFVTSHYSCRGQWHLLRVQHGAILVFSETNINAKVGR